jgi:hypothetical protein
VSPDERNVTWVYLAALVGCVGVLWAYGHLSWTLPAAFVAGMLSMRLITHYWARSRRLL